LSANNFDTKLKNGICLGENNSKKTIEKEDIQSQHTNKLDGKLNLYGNSNLTKTKDKTPLTQCTTVSVVRSLNSPIHQKPVSNSNKIDTDVSTYSIPVDTPLPPAIPVGGHKSIGPVCISSPDVTQNDIELNDNHEKEPLFSNKNDCSDKTDMNVASQKQQGISSEATFEPQNSEITIKSATISTKNDAQDSAAC